MNTNNILYAFTGISGYDVIDCSRKNGAICATLAAKNNSLKCPCCTSKNITEAGVAYRTLKHGTCNGWPILIHIPVQRVYCNECNLTRQIDINIASKRVSYTHAFARTVIDLAPHMTASKIAAYMNIDHGVIKDILKVYLKTKFNRISFKNVKKLGIDEVYVGYKRFLTLVVDLDSGAVIYIGKGRDMDTLKPFWKKLKRSGANIEAVASDMSRVYTLSIQLNIPDAIHVFDRFHVMKLMNKKLDDLRRSVVKSAHDIEAVSAIKGNRFLLLKNTENLNAKRNEQARLDNALRLNQPLFVAYYLKDDLRQFWQQNNKADAEVFLDEWIKTAKDSGIRGMITMGKTLERSKAGLLGWYDYPISTGPVEGINNKVGAIQRQAYGYRDEEYFHLRIYAAHLSEWQLTG